MLDISIDAIIESAINEAPQMQKSAEPIESKDNKYLILADNLDKIASDEESDQKDILKEYKNNQIEKMANFREIVTTYLELEK